jgi:SAM-dependent methyltransferase
LGGLGFPPARGRKALDVGCGDGLEAVDLLERGWRVDAVDLARHPAWDGLEKRYGSRIRFHVATDADLAAWTEPYGLVFQKDVLHHVPDPLGFLRTLGRLTAVGGELWVLECNRRNPVSYVHLTLLGGHQHFTAARLRGLMREAGLSGARAWTREARVWPVESRAFQKFVDGLQDCFEALPGWDRVAVYNLMQWSKP